MVTLLSLCVLVWKKSVFKRKERRAVELWVQGVLSACVAAPFYSQALWSSQLGFYLASLALYHLGEYFFVLCFHFETLSFDSFLLNQSTAYVLAMAFSMLEFLLTDVFFLHKVALLHAWSPTFLYTHLALSLSLLFIGQTFRISALFTAQRSFNHQIQFRKRDDHVLVTWGVYGLVRHPSYFGWFLWSVAT